MDPPLILTILALLFALGFGPALRKAARAEATRRKQAWRTAADRSALSDLVDWNGHSLGGRSGDLKVLLEPFPPPDGTATRIVVTGPLVAPLSLLLLDTKVRLQADVLKDSGWLASIEDDGRLTVVISGSQGADRIADALAGALELARRMRDPEELSARLARTVGSDPLGDVRLRSLEALLRDFPGSPHAREAAIAALRDDRPDVRLHAALALGPEGRATLQELACGERTPDQMAARALRELDEELAVPRVVELLAGARRANRLATVHASVEWLGRQRGPEAAATLAPLLASPNEELAAAAARALSAAAGPLAEPPLLERLATAASRRVLVEVAQALGRVGSAAAVAPLRQAADSWDDEAIGSAARQAVAEIQARLSGAAPGQLSLSAADAGQVSLAGGEDASGRLSNPEER
jgi:HEAT repeat protein